MKRPTCIKDVIKWIKQRPISKYLKTGKNGELLGLEIIQELYQSGAIVCYYGSHGTGKIIYPEELETYWNVHDTNFRIIPKEPRFYHVSLEPEIEHAGYLESDKDLETIALEKSAFLLWKESSSLSYEAKIRKRNEAVGMLRVAYNMNNQSEGNPYVKSKIIKWEGILLSKEDNWEKALSKFEEGLEFAKKYIPFEVMWFEAAINETRGWLKLKNALVSQCTSPYAEAMPNFEKAKDLYCKSADLESMNFVGYWIDLFEALKKNIFTDYELIKRVTCYLERDSPRAKDRKSILDPQGIFQAYRSVLMYNHLGQIANKLEVQIKDVFKKYLKIEVREPLGSLVSILKERRGIIAPPEIEWLVKNNNRKKHDAENKEKQEQHIEELAKNPQRLENVEVKIIEYLKTIDDKFKSNN